MTIALLALVAATQALPAPGAPGWEVIDTSRESEARIAPGSITRSGAIAHATMQLRMNRPRRGQTPLLVTRIRFDCGANTYAFEAGDSYDRTGTLTASFTAREDQIELAPIEPGSLEEIVQAAACTHAED